MRRLLTWIVVVLAALTLAAAPAPNDPMVADQWHLPQVGTFDAWRAGQGAGIVVAVVDTGVDRTHPDLQGRMTGGVDLVDRGTPPDDPNGHGTLVAGVVAASAGNGIGGAGASPHATIMPVRVLDADGSGRSGNVAEGIRWAARNGAHVINLSLAEAPGLVRDTQQVIGRDVEEAIAEADARGVLVVAAAGNEGRSSTPYDASVPALVVGASDRGDGVWMHSNRDHRTLFAPGVHIVSTYRQHGYARADGTSFATPIVSAGAALLRGKGLSPAQVRQRLIATAVPVGAGRGRVDLAVAMGAPPAPEPSPSPAAPAPPTAMPEPPPQDESPLEPDSAPQPPPEPQPDPEPAAGSSPPVVDEPPTPSPRSTIPEPAAVAFEAPPGAPPAEEAPTWPVGVGGALLAANIIGHAAVLGMRQRNSPLLAWRSPAP